MSINLEMSKQCSKLYPSYWQILDWRVHIQYLCMSSCLSQKLMNSLIMVSLIVALDMLAFEMMYILKLYIKLNSYIIFFTNMN